MEPRSLLDLPDAALSHVALRLDAASLVQLSMVCKASLAFVERDHVWAARCAPYTGPDAELWRALKPKALYAHLFHKYGLLLGTWRSPDRPYGAVVKVVARPPCSLEARWALQHRPLPAPAARCPLPDLTPRPRRLRACRYLVVHDLQGPALWRPLCQVLCGARGATVRCTRQALGPDVPQAHEEAAGCHAAALDLVPGGGGGGGGFTLTCTRAGCKQAEVELQARRGLEPLPGTQASGARPHHRACRLPRCPAALRGACGRSCCSCCQEPLAPVLQVRRRPTLHCPPCCPSATGCPSRTSRTCSSR
jgi:hypothetical protein